MIVTKGSTNFSLDIFVPDSSSTTGAGLTGLVFNSSGLTCYYRRGTTGSATSLTLVTLATIGTAHADGGFKEVDATNAPGLYRLDLSDAILATGVDWVTLHLKGATNMAPVNVRIQLSTLDMNTVMRGTDSASTFDPAADAVANVTLVATVTTNSDMRGTDSAALATVCTETRLAELDAANLPADVAAIPTTAMRGTDSAMLAASAPTNFGDLAITATTGLVTLAGVTHAGAVIPTVTTLTGHTVQTGDSFARLGAPSAGSVSADTAAVKVDTAAVRVITDAIGATAAANFALALGASGIIAGAAIAGTLSTTQMTTDLTEATDDHYIGRVIIWTSGVLAGQATDITDYTGSSKLLAYTATTEAPSAADAFIIV